MALNLDEWLTDLQKRGSLTDEERKQVEMVLTKPAVKQEVVDAFERQSDYSRKMAELQQQRKQEDEYAARLAAWEAGVKEKLTTAEATARQWQSKALSLAAQSGIDPTTLPDETPTAPVKVEQPVQDVMTKEEANAYASNLMRINAKIIALNTEHQRLYGKPMEKVDEFVDYALKEGKPLEETFRDFFKVAEREKEIQEESVQARIQQAIAEEKKKWVTDNTNPLGAAPSSRRPEQMSPVFATLQAEGNVPGDHALHRSRVAEVVQAWREEQANNG